MRVAAAWRTGWTAPAAGRRATPTPTAWRLRGAPSRRGCACRSTPTPSRARPWGAGTPGCAACDSPRARRCAAWRLALTRARRARTDQLAARHWRLRAGCARARQPSLGRRAARAGAVWTAGSAWLAPRATRWRGVQKSVKGARALRGSPAAAPPASSSPGASPCPSGRATAWVPRGRTAARTARPTVGRSWTASQGSRVPACVQRPAIWPRASRGCAACPGAWMAPTVCLLGATSALPVRGTTAVTAARACRRKMRIFASARWPAMAAVRRTRCAMAAGVGRCPPRPRLASVPRAAPRWCAPPGCAPVIRAMGRHGALRLAARTGPVSRGSPAVKSAAKACVFLGIDERVGRLTPRSPIG